MSAPAVGSIHTQNLPSSGVCLGGIGCGGIEVWPDGTFRHVAIANSRPWAGGKEGHNYAMDVGSAPDEPGFHPEDIAAILRVRVGEGKPQLRFLMRGHGVSFTSNGNMSRLYKYAVVPTIDAIDYDATFPFVRLTYQDAKLPVAVRLTAWTPFVPHDHEVSNTPGIVLDYDVENLTDEDVEVSILFSCRNYAGFDGDECKQEHELAKSSSRTVVRMRGDLNRPKAQSSGCMSVFAAPQGDQSASVIEANPYLENIFWSYYLRGDLDGELVPDFVTRVETCVPKDDRGNGVNKSYLFNMAWLTQKQTLAAKATTAFRFGITWFFPNHVDVEGEHAGKLYATRFQDSKQVADWLIDQADELKARSQAFVDRILDSDLEPRFALSLLDQAMVMAKATWLIENGTYFMWEGLGCCCMNTVDVDHYGSFGTIHLFPELRKTVTDLVQSVQKPNGQTVHGFPMRVKGPITEREYRRWDVNLQYLLGLYRDWKWTGDEDFLERHYDAAAKAFRFVAQLDKYDIGLPYIEGGITYDHWHTKGIVTYMANLWLTATHAMEALAEHRGDTALADEARQLRAHGQQHFDRVLWNGGKQYYNLYYYRQEGEEDPGEKIQHAKGEIAGDMGDFDPEAVAAEKAAQQRASQQNLQGGCDPSTGCCPPADPIHGEVRDDGLQTDALNGEGYAGIIGLPRSLDEAKTKATLRAIWEANHEPDLQFVVNGSYADGSFPDQWPFSQWQNPWTGSEYYFAAQLLAEGMVDEGLQVITDVFDRYTREGMRFNHIECNTHYSRAQSIYAAYDAWLGIDWDQPAQTLHLHPKQFDNELHAPVITGACWGALHLQRDGLRLTIDSGRGRLRRLHLEGIDLVDGAVSAEVDGKAVAVERDGDVLVFAESLELTAGNTLQVALG